MLSSRTLLRIILGVLILIAMLGTWHAFLGYIPGTCASVPKAPAEEGSQGYRIWSGETLKSFEHHGKRICVEDGWQALGADEYGDGYALFKKGFTGVLIQDKAFGTEFLTPQNSEYRITMRYPLSASGDEIREYASITENAFSRVGALYPEATKHTRNHTVLVTAGIAGNTRAPGTRVYPDPHEDLTLLVRTPDYPRGEELLIHAVAHLHNRHRKDLLAYQAFQDPVPPIDFEEMEATWTETAFLREGVGRELRLRYLYNVHTAVRTKDFSLIEEPPFDDEAAFKKIVEGIIVPEDAASLDYQYNHYVLAPLTMVALEGLLQEQKTGTDIEKLLTGVHTTSANFLDEIKTLLPQSEMSQVHAWIAGEETIPYELVLTGAKYYGP